MGEGGSICPGVALSYVLRGGAVHVAHLFGLQAMQAALKAGDGETWHGSFLKADTYWGWVPFSVVYVGFTWVTGSGCCRV